MIEEVKAKTILTKVSYGKEWYGIDYNMNLYRGCSHGCIYCDSRSECYQIEDFDHVKKKAQALAILEQELQRKRKKGIIGMGSMSDPYNPAEVTEQLTRGALQLIAHYGFGVAIDTKSPLILRDLDILKKINQKNQVIVKLTITTPEDHLSKIIEPYVASSSKRFETIKILRQNNIFTGIMLNPVLPYLTDQEESLKSMVRLAFEHDAKFIHTFMGMTLRDRQREYYYQQLEKHFPNLKEQYQKTYGNRYFCSPKASQQLYQVFQKECNRYQILYRMSEIIAAYPKKQSEQEQLELF